jgi:hypothetical protein
MYVSETQGEGGRFTMHPALRDNSRRKGLWGFLAIIGVIGLLALGKQPETTSQAPQTQNTSGLPAREEEKLEKLVSDVSAKLVAVTLIYEQYCGPVSDKAKQSAKEFMRYTSEERVRREILDLNGRREFFGNTEWCSVTKPGMESD